MKKNIANAISALRIVISPIIVFLLIKSSFVLATVVYLFGLFTDVLDGYIARRYRLTSAFGKVWDPTTSAILFYSTSLTLVFLDNIYLVYPLLIGIYSIAASFVVMVSKDLRINNFLNRSIILVGGGFGDVGLGLIMTYLFLNKYFSVLIVTSFGLFLLKTYIQRNQQILTF